MQAFELAKEKINLSEEKYNQWVKSTATDKFFSKLINDSENSRLKYSWNFSKLTKHCNYWNTKRWSNIHNHRFCGWKDWTFSLIWKENTILLSKRLMMHWTRSKKRFEAYLTQENLRNNVDCKIKESFALWDLIIKWGLMVNYKDIEVLFQVRLTPNWTAN